MRPPNQGDPSGRQEPDLGLDAIPMNRPSVATYVGLAVGVLAVGGIVVWSLSGGARAVRPERAAAPPGVAPSGEALPVDRATQREHLALTQRALAAAEAKKREREGAEPAPRDQASGSASPAARPPAPAEGVRPTPGPAAPAGDDLDALGDDIAAKLR